MMFSALFFDFFGTLVDIFQMSDYFQNLTDMANVLGIKPSKFRDQWMVASMARNKEYQSVSERVLDACERTGAGCNEEKLKEAVEIRTRFFITRTEPRSDAIPVLEWAQNRGYALGLITNCTIELPYIWETHALAPFFPAPIFSSVENVRKPTPEIYLRACEKLGVDPRESAFIGDGDDHEMDGASAVGMTPLLIIDHDPASFRRHPQPEMEYSVDYLSELPDLIQK